MSALLTVYDDLMLIFTNGILYLNMLSYCIMNSNLQ